MARSREGSTGEACAVCCKYIIFDVWSICIRGRSGRVPILPIVHELGLAAEIHRIARETADARGGGRLESVTVVVGDLAAVEPDLLEFAWSSLVAGSRDEDARLVVDWRPARQLCPSCGEVPERAAGSWLRLCPRCQTPLAVEGGDDLEVRTVTFCEGAA
jgi:hydrogenase nickel incorporation protein HypA/HybF